ncbi:MAG: tRNA (adenosine(37)-N6)-threonylcarbamoyltransferase complex ATPase subunit type 1 TsaE [Candidatus Dormibacteria bacterium]
MSGVGALLIRSRSVAETEAAGRLLGGALLAGDLLGLEGDLGAGKTCLVRGIVAGLGGDAAEVRSPTFVLQQVHRGGRIPLHHLDLYRLGNDADVAFLEVEGLLDEGAVAVEWASRAKLQRLRPIVVTLEGDGPDGRVIRLEDGAPERLRRAWSGR